MRLLINERRNPAGVLHSGLIVTAIVIGGCDGCGDSGSIETARLSEAESPSPRPNRPAHVGTVRGVVRLKAGVELPAYAPDDIHGPQAMSEWTAACPAFRDEQRSTVRLAEGRGLEGIVVYAGSDDRDGFFNALPDEPQPITHEVSIDGCFLSKGTLSTTIGDTIRVRQNSREENFLPTLAGGAFADALPFGQTRDYTLDRGGVTVLSCAFAAPCGRTDIVVHYHPVHTVTDEEGRFVLDNVPAVETVDIVAWHPLFDYARGQIHVDEGGEVTLDLELEPPKPEPVAPNVEPPELI